MQPETDWGYIADEVAEFDDFYPEWGTAITHWTDSSAQEEVERNPIGFVWQT